MWRVYSYSHRLQRSRCYSWWEDSQRKQWKWSDKQDRRPARAPLCAECHIWLQLLWNCEWDFSLKIVTFKSIISYLIHLVNMRFYDLRRRLCEEREVTGLAGLHCPGPGNESVQCTAFTKRNENNPLKLDIPKRNSKLSRSSPTKTTSVPSSPQSPSSVNIDFSSDSDSGTSRCPLASQILSNRTD